MEKMYGACGLVCSECGAYLATQADDDEARKTVAETWSKEFNADIKWQDINCDGCMSGSDRLFNHCYVCEIRACVAERGLTNCAFCADYACDKLTGFFAMAPVARDGLEEIRRGV